MADELQEPTVETTPKAGALGSPPSANPEIDFVLQALVDFVNQGAMEFGITLLVQGLLVSGQLTSFHRYAGEFREKFQGALPPELREDFGSLLDAIHGVPEPAEQAEVLDKAVRHLPQFIH